MHIHVKRSIIAALSICSCAIFTSAVYAQSSPSQSNQLPPTVDTVNKTQPASIEQCQTKSYLFECEHDNLITDTLKHLEGFQIWLGGYVQNTGEGIDTYFGSTDSFDLAQGSRLDIMLPMVLHDSGKVEFQLRTRAKIALPKTRRSWHLLVSSQDSGITGTTNNELANELVAENNQASLGLQALIDGTKNNEISFDFGVKFANVINLNPYVRIKKRFEWKPVSGWNNRMINTLFWERVDGPGFNTKVVLDKPISEPYLFRSQTEGTWWQDEPYYDITQRLLVYQILNSHRVLTYQTWTRGDSLSGRLKNTAYGVNVNWRERAYKNWLYFDVQPGVEWSDENNFGRPDITLTLMLEMRFFKKRK
ncbi:MAG: hypothetical protein JXK16_04640 [Thiotrichales bacterium]|nr:hypothetical protein [Thiotrichales bacterium]